MPRFVILHHLMPPEHQRESHWDLMLEHDTLLLTWALSAEPLSQTISCERLPDHRLKYLEYEGPISGNRGYVELWDRGTFTWISGDLQAFRGITPSRWAIFLSGKQLQGRAELARLSIEDWTYRLIRDQTDESEPALM